MPSSPILKALGLNFSPNPLDLPPGSLTEASNIIIRRDNIIESRRGYKVYDTGFGTSSDTAKQLAVYKNRILVHYNNKLAFENGTFDENGLSNFDDFSGNYSETAEGLRIKSIEVNGNFYFTTSEGIQKISAATAGDLTTAANYIQKAGVVQGIDFSAKPIYSAGSQSGFLPVDSAVAYRVVWAIVDKNNNLIRGAPSQIVQVYNDFLSTLIRDMTNVLGSLDDIDQTGSLITNGNYVETFKLPINALASELRTNLIELAKSIDNDILLVDNGGSAPLVVTNLSINAGIATLTFSTDVTSYFEVGSKIYISNLTNLKNADDTIANGAYTIATVTPFTVTFLTTAKVNSNFDDAFTSIGTSGVNTKSQLVTIAADVSSPYNAIVTVSSGNLDFLRVGTPLVFYPDAGGSLPTNLNAGTTYYVKTLLSTTTFTVSAVSGGAAITLASGATSTAPIKLYSNPIVGVPSITVANPAVVTVTNSSGLTNGLPIVFSGTGTLPTGLSLNTVYYIVNLSGTTFNVAGFPGGFPIATTGGSLTGTIVLKYSSSLTVDTGTVHGLSAGSAITFSSTGTLPSGISSSTTYYVLPQGLTTTSFTFSAAVNGDAVVAYTAGTGTHTVKSTQASADIAALKINLNEFRSITEPDTPSDTPTHNQLVSLQTYLSKIITTLQELPSGILSVSLKNSYIANLDVTNAANVKLKIIVPEEITENHFLQLYRTDVATASGTSVLSLDVSPGDEMKLVYEAYLTAQELANLEMTVIDQTLDDFAGAFLYTNAATGEGILQSNYIPPFAKDINTFKNVTFYANTRTRHSKNIALLGISKIVETLTLGSSCNFTLANQDGTYNTYNFVKQTKQKVAIQMNAGSFYVPASPTAPCSYFTINSANNENKYYVWFNPGTGVDPAVSERIGIEVKINPLDTKEVVSQKLMDQINLYPEDFAATNSYDLPAQASTSIDYMADPSPGFFVLTSSPFTSNRVILSSGPLAGWGSTVKFTTTGTPPNAIPGPLVSGGTYYPRNAFGSVLQLANGPSMFDPIFTFLDVGTGTHSIVNLDWVEIVNAEVGFTDEGIASSGLYVIYMTGNGEQASQHTYKITCTLPSPLSTLAGRYVSFLEVFSINRFYIWFKVNGVGTDPALPYQTGILVNLVTGETPQTAAAKIAAALNAYENGNVVTVEQDSTNLSVIYVKNVKYGPITFMPISTAFFPIVTSQVGALNVALSDAISDAQAVEQTAQSLVRVINKNKTENSYAFYTSDSRGVPGKITIQARDLNTIPFYITTNLSNVGNSFNPDLSPTITISSVVDDGSGNINITTSTPHGLLNKDYIVISGTPSGQYDGYAQVQYINANQFKIAKRFITSSIGNSSLIPATAAVISENENKPNRIYYSKLNEPEAVPIVNYFDVGAKDRAILRIFPLRDTLFVLKEDGLFRISGETAPFTLSLFDSSCIITAADSVAISNNVIYVWTTQGISMVTESGVNVVSRPIDTEILKVSSSSYTNFKTATFGIGYDSDNSYTVFTVKNTADTVATIAYRYSNLTNSWTSFDFSKTCGLIRPVDDKMYLGASDINKIEQERKNFNRTDYADREYLLNLTQNNYLANKQLRLLDVSKITVGDVLLQEQTITVYNFNSLLRKLDLDPNLAFNDYESTLSISAGANVRNALVDLANKLNLDTSLNPTNFLTPIQSLSGVITNIGTGNPAVITSANHGLINGRVVTISGCTTVPNINGNYEVTVIDNNTFSINYVATQVLSLGSWITNDSDIQDLKTCYNKIITLLEASAGAAFPAYEEITTTTSVEAIVTNVNYATKIVTLNLQLNYLVGVIKSYEGIKTKFTYSPNHFGDPLTFKHFRETTLMFLNKAFTSGILRVGTDLLPQLIEIPFNGDGNGLFGYAPFGQGFFGGASHPAPLRTYIPRQCQRCRYIVIQFEHHVAREQYGITGMTLTGEVYSIRAYR